MCNTLIHRGPDDEGVYVEGNIGLGQRRLSIIDLSKQAAPPLSNEDGSVWVVFNGEIYNFKLLRADLEKKGHVFKTSTDTEVIVHLYEEYGVDCLEHLRGMFSLAIWDGNRKQLFAARDRVGKKPFYYSSSSKSLIFASEIKAIAEDPEISLSPNYAAIDSYLSRQYVPSPLTAFADILKLPAGHYLVCSENGVKIERYWVPPLAQKTLASYSEVKEELSRLINESVKLRLMSDVPLGALLSGGVDSGTIVALMARQSSKTVKTFSIGFDEDDFNELPYARKVAERYETDHHEFIVKPNVAEVLPELVKHYNDPFADSSAVPSYYVSRMARQHVTVALTGDGGDECFAGYSHYAQVLQWECADVIPWPIRKFVFGAASQALGLMPYSNTRARWIRAFHMMGAQLPERYRVQMSLLKDQEKQAGYTSFFHSLIQSVDNQHLLPAAPWAANMDSLDWMMRYDLTNYLPDCLMVKSDVASMANGLELRSPFLDHKVIEFAGMIPNQMKRKGNMGKLILKEIAKDLLPSEIMQKKKTGFSIPLAKWLRGELNDLMNNLLLDGVASRRGLFRQEFMQKLVHEHVSGKRDWSRRLWSFMCLELWFREFID